MDENKDGYDRDEMKKREFVFELSKLDVLLKSFLALGEWKLLQEKYGFDDKEYPNLVGYLKPAKKILDTNSQAYKNLFENPLVKLAIISQPTQPEPNENKE